MVEATTSVIRRRVEVLFRMREERPTATAVCNLRLDGDSEGERMEDID